MAGGGPKTAAPFFLGENRVPDDEAGSAPSIIASAIAEDEFLVDRIFPTKRLHILAAPVGVGKTTLLFQLCCSLLENGTFLGRPAHRREGIVYLAADRTRRETYATLRRMNMLELIPQIKWLFTDEMATPGMNFLELLLEQHTRAGQLFIVEPLLYFLRDGNNKMGNPNDYLHVSHFIGKLKRSIEKVGVTMLCSLHSAKVKGTEGYAAMREKVLGSNAWGGTTNTVIFVEPRDPEDSSSPYRKIHVMPRDSQAFVLDYMQESAHGLLIPAEAPKPFKNKLQEQFDAYEGEAFTIADAIQWADTAAIARKTLERWLNQKIQDGYVERLERGTYRKRQPA